MSAYLPELFIDKIAGLPLHPLVVHLVVILVPLAAFGVVSTCWRASWRQSYLLPLAALAIVGAVAAVIATNSGDALETSLRHAASASGTRVRLGDHPNDGELARNLSILFALVMAGFSAMLLLARRQVVKPWVYNVLYVLSSLTGIAAAFAILVAGHSGAALVWKNLGNFVSSQPK